MNFIEPTVEIITESDPLKKIELIGRVCYKSESKITEFSHKAFFKQLVNNQHYAMLEHATVTFQAEDGTEKGIYLRSIPYIQFTEQQNSMFSSTYYITLSLSHFYNPIYKAWTAWLRQIFESESQSAIDNRIKIIDPTATPFDACVPDKHKFISIKFTCSRGISHELVRHRCSVAQESTRYCNYSQDKFRNEITYITPSQYSNWNESQKLAHEKSLRCAEYAYFQMLNSGLPPEEARDVLPNALKTEVVLTMNIPQWKHFFDIRLHGTTGKPHPDMKVLASIAYDKLKSSQFARYF